MKQTLLKSIQNKEFKIYLQPKIDTKTEKIVGAEALIRKQEETKILEPKDFIPHYEKNGLITILDMYVLREVCKLQRKWKEENLPLFPIAVNESRHHLKNPNYAQDLKKILEEENASPAFIELEMTETSVLEDIELAKKAAEQVKRLGFIVSMDDFGTGYTSFRILKDIEIDILKIDQSFFKEIKTNTRAQIIIEAIVQMCKKLNTKTIAEGIESKEQLEFVKKIDCDIVQGYIFSKPLTIQEFEKKYLYPKEKS